MTTSIGDVSCLEQLRARQLVAARCNTSGGC